MQPETETTPGAALVDQGLAPKKADPAPGRVELVKAALDRVKRAKKKHKKAFERMDRCMEIARIGGNKEWADDDPTSTDRKFTVPLLNRHVNLVVAQVYAKNPKAYATRRKKLQYAIWDGTQDSLQAAMQTIQAGMAAATNAMVEQNVAAAGMGHNGGPSMPMEPPQLDPNAMALLQEVFGANEDDVQIDRMGKTLELLWSYFLDEQAVSAKAMLKGVVRRAKVCGVGYVKLGYQRELEKRPEVTAKINDITDKIAYIERLIEEQKDGDADPDSANIDDLKLQLQDLQNQEVFVVREGPVLDDPRSKSVIPDVKCKNLKTLAGSDEVWHEFEMSREDIQEVYRVDLKGTTAKPYTERDGEGRAVDQEDDEPKYRVYEGWNKRKQQMYVVVEGYDDFLVEPKTPDVWTERFWPFYPLVFNESEHEKEVYPLSDVWLGQDMQDEYNRARQGVREHRVQNRPGYAVERGKLDTQDKTNLQSRPSGAVVELNALVAGQKIDDVLQPIKTIGIDPNLYTTQDIFDDLTRAIGSAEANFGDPGDSTATGSSIAENSRMSTLSENVDELDDVLGALAKGMGQVMLLNLARDTVLEIAGPGAVWPDMPETRQDVVKDLFLDVKGGSSGRPNRAAELANLERAMPWILQMPGVKPLPFVRKYLDLLDIDFEEATAQGLPSIQAINSMLAKMPLQAQAGAGPQNPALQGAAGAANQTDTQQNEPQGQPAMPSPAPGGAPV